MSSDQINQSAFTSDKELSQDAFIPSMPPAPVREVKRPSPFLFVIVLAGLLGIIGFATYFSLSHSAPKVEETPIPTASSSARPTESRLRDEIKPQLDEVKKADPDQNTFPFPPVDLRLQLLDAQEVR